MQSITGNLFDLTLTEIDYRISALRSTHLEILAHIARGKTDEEIADFLNIKVPALRTQIYSACDRAGVRNRAQLIALFSIWRYVRYPTE